MATLSSATKTGFTLGGGSSFVDVVVPSYDAAKTILFHSYRVDDSNGRDSCVFFEKLNSTTVRVQRLTTSASPIDGWIFLARFSHGVQVQDVSTTTPNSTVGISSVPTRNTFVLGSGLQMDGANLGQWEGSMLTLNASGSNYVSLSFSNNATPTSYECHAQVVTYQGAKVTVVTKLSQTGNWSQAFSPSLSAPVLVASSAEYISGSVGSDSNGTLDTIPGASLNANRSGGTDSKSATAYVAELRDGTVAQHVTDNVGSGSTTGNAGISAVTSARTCVMGNAEQNNPCMMRSNNTGSAYGQFMFSIDLQSTTNIRGTRAASGDAAAWAAGVFEFSDAPPVYPVLENF